MSRSRPKYNPFFLLLPVLLLVVFILDIILGSINIPIPEFWSLIKEGTTGSTARDLIITDIRVPKVLTGLMAGAGLGISGLIMQTLFRNPLAGPFVLGISSGASLGVAFVILASLTLIGTEPGKWLVILAGGAGSGVIMLVILGVASKTRDNMSLLIVGLMIGSLSGAVISILQYYSNARQLQVFMLWSFGNLSNINWPELVWFIPIVLLGIISAFLLSRTMNVFLLSENYASTLGVNVFSARLAMIVITSVLAGIITAFCGPIAFIGIAVPHLTRILLNTSDHKVLVPAVSMAGSILLIICDIIASIPLSDRVLPVNAVTSLVGAPVVIWLIINRRSISKTFG